jgi:hypothetical protein
MGPKVTMAPAGLVQVASTISGNLSVGGVVSRRTITLKVHRAEFRTLSAAAHVTVLVPGRNTLPDGGVQVSVASVPQ